MLTADPCPPVYQLRGLTRRSWKNARDRLIRNHTLSIRTTPPEPSTSRAVLLVASPGRPPALAISGWVERRRTGRFALSVAPPPLSWRLASVALARRLPDTPSSAPPWGFPQPTVDDLPDAPVGVRTDFPSPGSTLAPTSELFEVVSALRAGFAHPESVLDDLDASPGAMHFLAAMYATGILVTPPPPLRNWRSPFAFFGLHWSVCESIVRRRYHRLRGPAKNTAKVAGVDAEKVLDRGFDLLVDPAVRRRIRRRIVAPVTFAEVTGFYRRRLREARRHARRDEVARLTRRLAELDADPDRSVQ